LSTKESVSSKGPFRTPFEFSAEWTIADQNELRASIFFLHVLHGANQKLRAFPIGEAADKQNGGLLLSSPGRKQLRVDSNVVDANLLSRKVLLEKFSSNKLGDGDEQPTFTPNDTSLYQIAAVPEGGTHVTDISRRGVRSVKSYDERQTQFPRQWQRTQSVRAEMCMH
jgi:hypothetical protein